LVCRGTEMLFEVNHIKTTTKRKTKATIKLCKTFWNPKESVLEGCLMSTAESEAPILNSDVFGEPLLLISNQVKTRHRKRADILALDRMGNGVIVELKRNEGSLGVETQALQYLADFSRYQGQDFISHFSKESNDMNETILGFLGAEVNIKDINKNSRIILMARAFDSTLFSMGEWLSTRGVAFRCVAYSPVAFGRKQCLSFSVVFDRSPELIFPLSFESRTRKPAYYWHNIGLSKTNKEQWWRYLVEKKKITTSFYCQAGDQGERILKKYIAGDTVIAYATGFGAIGWGVIEKPNSYKLLKSGSPEDVLNGFHLHRLDIKWKCVFDKLSDAIRPEVIRDKYGLYHPISTSVKVDEQKAKRLIEDMQRQLKEE
ncbi:MAG: hypothetical protein KAR47_17540, partial [Planctomycetes bacterium]|nr:hypothetical protein [Planctomycetota bacterium]